VKYLSILIFLSSQIIFAHNVDLTHLPLGDGKLSQEPKKGWIWACGVDPHGQGAQGTPEWIHSDGTYDLTKKAVVSGSVNWPSKFVISTVGDKRVFTLNDFPKHPTGIYPIGPSDAAYAFDKNPSKISEQSMSFSIPKDPVLAAQASCAAGAVGVLLSGAVLFNALDAPGRDAVAHETQDKCQGHPQESGVYHYHNVSSCVEDKRDASGHSALVGYALDGFGIYGHYGEGGKELSSDDLDECHGHTHEIVWNGKKVKMYHYHATWDFPYTVGCFRGSYESESVRIISGPPPQHILRERGRRGLPKHPPDLKIASGKLGISESALREALGPPPPDLSISAKKLGISLEKLRDALGAPPREP